MRCPYGLASLPYTGAYGYKDAGATRLFLSDTSYDMDALTFKGAHVNKLSGKAIRARRL
ncbi:hypothetical protein FACS1894181_10140 [Bacteroidia bacterium]|nr:hypothetical protein FACS1894181_10140 [Bacteroidia bacterium]